MENMNIFLSATKNYVLHAAELLFSIRRFSKKHISAYILVDDQSTDIYNKFFADIAIADMSVKIFPIGILDQSLSVRHNSKVLTKMTFGRMMIFDLLPELEKILYLDVDMLVMNFGIDGLYDMDLCDKYAAVCEEITVEIFDKREMANCGVKRYFNGGLMLMNLRKMREDGVDRKCMEMVVDPPEFFNTGGMQDQSIANIAFRENVVFVNPAFDVQSILFGYPQYDEYSKAWGYADQIDLFRHCVVSHMQGAKPWEDRWNTWQAWQLPFKKWQYDYYMSNKSEFIKSCPNAEKYYHMEEFNK